MVTIQIDGRTLQVPQGTTILKAAEGIGIVIPRYCYHPAFEPEGSCRMCLVEIEGLPKLDLACSTVVREGMKVWTSTPRVLQARQEVLGFFLADHPLDCPICDKAGECYLQIYYDQHGRYASRFLEPKEKKGKMVPIGKKLLLDRERCILCTRCVRFLRRVTGTGELGVFERGVKAEIGIDEAAPVANNYSGNLVDICPVGAITDRDFRFKTRVWFLENRRSICPRCSRGCNILIQSVHGYPLPEGRRRVYRVVPAENPEVNGYWMCDLGRGLYHDIEDDRRDAIAVKGEAAAAKPLSWEAALKGLASDIGAAASGRPPRLGLVLSSSLTNEELAMCRRLFVESLGVRQVSFADPAAGEADGPLLTTERTPNRRGVQALGFEPKPPDLAGLSASVDLLVVFGRGLLDCVAVEEVAQALAKVRKTYLLAAHRSALDALADVVLPTAVPAEKQGSFTNTNGLTQVFDRALQPRGEARAEAAILAGLATELKVRLD